MRAVLLGVLYLVLAAAAARLTRLEGGVACLWIANGLLIAVLIGLPFRRWAWPIATCSVATFIATALFGFGPAGALPFMLFNIGEALISATLLVRWGRKDAFESVAQLGSFVLAVGIIGPAAMTLPAATTAVLLSDTDFWSNALNYFLAHALGSLTFTPIVAMILAGDAGRWIAAAGSRRLAEGGGLLLLVAVTSFGVFSQTSLPLLFLPILPIVYSTFRLGRLGAAAAVMILTTIGGVLTAQGFGPIFLLHGTAVTHAQFLQFYLAATMLSALPIAADLSRRDRLYRQIQESEARFRLITEHATDIVMTTRRDGTIRYVSPSIGQLGGYLPETLIGRSAIRLVAPQDRDHVRAEHARALQRPGEVASFEYRALTAGGGERWFESNIRAILDADGAIEGVISVIRDIDRRKAIEVELAKAAATDVLTGLANRRAFATEFDLRLADGSDGGCVALFDIDHFKRINDRYGHEAGDRVIQAFGRVARRHVREHDLVARLGGEEFGIILPGANSLQGFEICETLRRALGAEQIDIGNGETVTMTVSAGVAMFTCAQHREDVMRAADIALYQAKGTGRDRLVLAA